MEIVGVVTTTTLGVTAIIALFLLLFIAEARFKIEKSFWVNVGRHYNSVSIVQCLNGI